MDQYIFIIIITFAFLFIWYKMRNVTEHFITPPSKSWIGPSTDANMTTWNNPLKDNNEPLKIGKNMLRSYDGLRDHGSNPENILRFAALKEVLLEVKETINYNKTGCFRGYPNNVKQVMEYDAKTYESIIIKIISMIEKRYHNFEVNIVKDVRYKLYEANKYEYLIFSIGNIHGSVCIHDSAIYVIDLYVE